MGNPTLYIPSQLPEVELSPSTSTPVVAHVESAVSLPLLRHLHKCSDIAMMPLQIQVIYDKLLQLRHGKRHLADLASEFKTIYPNPGCAIESELGLLEVKLSLMIHH
jgi:hypothetical protein